MATEYATDSKPGSPDDAMFHYRFHSIGTACGGEATRGGKHRGDAELIEANRKNGDSANQVWRGMV